MPGFHIHISASTMLGIGYGAAAFTLYDVPLPTAALATTLCSVSGMLPDLDSGPGRPMHESIAAAAAAIPMMLVDRMRSWGWTHESMILAGAGIYLFVRFGIGHMLKHWTVHRGIFHSFPVALIFTEMAFLVCSTGDLHSRYFKAGAIAIGFLSHLILDEIWSVDFRHARLKSSFGTALKFWCPCWWSNTVAYLLTAAMTLLTMNDPIWVSCGKEGEEMHMIATTLMEHLGVVERAAADFGRSLESNLPALEGNSGGDAVAEGIARFVERKIFHEPPSTFAPASKDPAAVNGGAQGASSAASEPAAGGPIRK